MVRSFISGSSSAKRKFIPDDESEDVPTPPQHVRKVLNAGTREITPPAKGSTVHPAFTLDLTEIDHTKSTVLRRFVCVPENMLTAEEYAICSGGPSYMSNKDPNLSMRAVNFLFQRDPPTQDIDWAALGAVRRLALCHRCSGPPSALDSKELFVADASAMVGEVRSFVYVIL